MSIPHLNPVAPLQPKKLIYTIEDETPISVYWDGTTLSFTGYGRVDTDGIGPSHGDADHQNDTSLHRDGKPLNADVDFYAVIPLSVIDLVPQVFLGCQVFITYQGKRIPAVCGDSGPRARGGEAAWIVWGDSELGFGVNANPNSGGIDSPVVLYEFLPGQAAVVNGMAYELQPA